MITIKDYIVAGLPETLFSGFYTPGTGDNRAGLNTVELLLKKGFNVYSYPGQGKWSDQAGKKPNNYFPESIPNKEYVHLGYTLPYLYESYLNNKKCVLKIFYVFEQSQVSNFKNNYGNSVVISQYAGGGNRHEAIKSAFASKMPFYFLPYIIDIEQFSTNGWGRKKIFWNTKGGLGIELSVHSLTRKLLYWVHKKLLSDEDLHFDILSCPVGNLDLKQSKAHVKNNKTFDELFKGMFNRVNVLTPMNYQEIKNNLMETKLITPLVITRETYGSAPLEAAALGIPTVQSRMGPFFGTNGIVYSEFKEPYDEYLNLLDKFFYDEDFYCSSLEHYQGFVKKYHSLELFMDILNYIIEKHL